MAEKIYLLVNIYYDHDKIDTEICPAEHPRLGPALSQVDGRTCWYGYPIVPINLHPFGYPYAQCYHYLHPAAPEGGIRNAYIIALDLDALQQALQSKTEGN